MTTFGALLRNKTAYLGTSFVLLLASLPLVSAGSTSGPASAGSPGLLWTGIVCMAVGTLLLPIQRLLTGTDKGGEDAD